ncbi:hypothetical protein VTK26DRAFT_8913 [Humicola hyalothermophila]
MGAAAGFCLRATQLFVRSVQFGCGAIVFGIFSYFLATLHNHDLPIDVWVRAVEGISGAAVVYTILSILIHFCAPGHRFPSFVQICLDVLFIAGFIYVAVANRAGASSCQGEVDTPYGRGNADTNESVDSSTSGITQLPSFRLACKLETAVLAVSIIAVFFFIFSPFLSVALVRHRRKQKRLVSSLDNNYTSGFGTRAANSASDGQGVKKKGGLFSIFGLGGRKDPNDLGTAGTTANPNALPPHATPGDVRSSYATEQTRVGSSSGGFGGGGGGYGGLGGFDDNDINSKYGSSSYGLVSSREDIPMGRYPNSNSGGDNRYDSNGNRYW